MKKTDRVLPQDGAHSQTNQDDAGEGDDEQGVMDNSDVVKVMETTASFDSITVWNHGGQPDLDEDPHARGVREWIAFAEAVRLEPATFTNVVGTDQSRFTENETVDA